MLDDTLPGLSLWLNWGLCLLLVLATVWLLVAYNVMARKAPPLGPGQRSEEHVLHPYRNLVGFIGMMNGLMLLGLVAVRVDARGGWLLVLGVAVVMSFTVVMALGFSAVRHFEPSE